MSRRSPLALPIGAVLACLTLTTLAGALRGATGDPRTPAQALDDLRARASGPVEALFSTDGESVRTVRGRLTAPGPLPPRQAAERFLSENAALHGGRPDLSDLRLDQSRESPAGRHLRYRQLFRGLPVFDAGVDIHVSPDGSVFLVHNRFAPRLEDIPALDVRGAPALSADDARRRVRDLLGGSRPVAATPIAELGIYPGGEDEAAAPVTAGGPRPAWRLVVRIEEPAGAREYLIDARTGGALRVRDLAAEDLLTGSGRVFDPNPVATLGDPTLRDDNDADGPQFATAYRTVALPDLRRAYLDRFGPVILSGPHVRISDLIESPYLARVTSPTGEFPFTRDQDGFEDVMAYFHVDRTQRYIQSLGFTDLDNRPILVDPHGLRGAKNAHYIGFPPGLGWIAFGTGGVDLAEDADVIWHEYGHSMQDNSNPGAYLAIGEAGAQGEGFGDYWAYVNTVLTSPAVADPECIGEWAFEGVCLRRTDTHKHYPEDITHEVHADGEIWSSVLRQVALAAGPGTANTVILESHFLVPVFPRFCAGAAALRDADDALYGGTHRAAIGLAAAGAGIASDLAPGGVVLTPVDAASNEVRFEIANQGPCASGTFAASIRLVGVVSGDQGEVGRVTVDPIVPNAAAAIDLTVPALAGEACFYRIIVDAGDVEQEVNESNNSVDSPVTSPAP